MLTQRYLERPEVPWCAEEAVLAALAKAVATFRESGDGKGYLHGRTRT